ncbi:probable leucine--tRNA ligase, mitochondrial isoform X2 [Pectinophora gossypiella]|uniref:probable leucine--tRNA ligase, mitochondrial isoform X2 n=1 Tax=Pectinophora gossypiella TaxID=13191 RepID=UPI00214E92AC|nr:probable leucine--tRNA ligase, mitochondrial isoform X2 [Pectinophora gossypiella]
MYIGKYVMGKLRWRKLNKIMISFKRLHFLHLHCRNKSSLGLWQEDLCTNIKLNVEKHWSNEVRHGIKNDTTRNYFYVLPMFPYPSGNLHMGHVRVYSLSDTISRFQKLCGQNVIHPIGWDAFGLPAENAAIERNIQPNTWTNSNIDSMKKQLVQMGFEFNWDRELSTCDPKYYKWTQYIFLKLFEKGLTYQSKAIVNWDPVDQTVLADEQVDELGCSWRSGAKVEKKVLTQWFIKTTKYAKKLYDGLNNKALENWKDIINLQKHWIGECNGVVVTFQIVLGDKASSLEVWTSEPYKFIHGTFLTISTNSIITQDITDTHFKVINPLTNKEMPVYITDNVDYPEGRDVYIACPQLDQKDEVLANTLNLPPVQKGSMINVDTENKKAINCAYEMDVGGHFVSSKLKDWLISRQRYWGTPIPIIHCGECGTVPVPYEDLPVELPISNHLDTGIQTLAKLDEWVNCKCPICKSDARRETDTMDTFVDSSWYYYRFLDPHNSHMPFNKDKLVGKTPVHIYIGGKEHAVLHLYYARFMSYFLHSLGWTPTEEPFKKLLVQGMIMGQSYKLKSSGKYIPPDTVEQVGKEYKEKETGEPVIMQWEKMSKSKHNGENPERLLSAYGCDTTRLLMLADVPPATSRHWSDATLPGVLNWQHRLWLTIREFLKHRNDDSLHKSNNITKDEFKKFENKLWDSKNYFIATATYHFKHTQHISNKVHPEIISNSKEFEIALASLIIMLAPVTPHFCSELWAGFTSAPHRINSDAINWEKGVLEQKWPRVNDDYCLQFQCKIDGADRCELKIKASDLENLSEDKALQMMIKEQKVSKRLKTGILKTKYELYPGCRAILHIFTNRPTQPIQEKLAE